jgi:3-keto-disaccharide hydrolase
MKYILMIITATTFIACNSASSSTNATDTTTAADTTTEMSATDTGWVNLFDGTTLNRWHTFGATTVSDKWSVDSGAIHFNPDTKGDDGDLVTNDSFANFDLKIDWKIATGGNSGILIYVQDDKARYEETYTTGPEMQVLDDERNEDNKKPSHHAGSLYDLILATPGAVHPAEQWNTAEIISNNGKLDFYLNNVHVVNTTMWDDGWKQMLAKSKFKQWPAFGTFKSGHIALQDHGFNVWYKNVMIKKL